MVNARFNDLSARINAATAVAKAHAATVDQDARFPREAFEEIRRKYRSDRDFMRTVDRYIGEFERLLDEVSRDDRGQVVARTYLTSETGKVYTMLAHAAGRFE